MDNRRVKERARGPSPSSLNLTEFPRSPGNRARYVKWTAFILEH